MSNMRQYNDLNAEQQRQADQIDRMLQREAEEAEHGMRMWRERRIREANPAYNAQIRTGHASNAVLNAYARIAVCIAFENTAARAGCTDGPSNNKF